MGMGIVFLSGWLGVGAPGSPALFQQWMNSNLRGLLIMRLRIFDGVIFEISRVLESLFDLIEYHAAKHANRI